MKIVRRAWRRFLPKQQSAQPLSSKRITLVLLILVVSLAIAAGYFQVLYKMERKRYLRLEDRYVRVRNMLGREKTQELIDLSRR